LAWSAFLWCNFLLKQYLADLKVAFKRKLSATSKIFNYKMLIFLVLNIFWHEFFFWRFLSCWYYLFMWLLVKQNTGGFCFEKERDNIRVLTSSIVSYFFTCVKNYLWFIKKNSFFLFFFCLNPILVILKNSRLSYSVIHLFCYWYLNFFFF
jgi:hypothetical protein